MLLALAKKLRAEVTRNAETFTAGQPIGTLTDIQLYQQPRYGEVDGVAVRIEGEANMVGFSPVTKCVELGEHGETAWIPAELPRNIRLDPFGFGGGTRGRAPRTRPETTK